MVSTSAEIDYSKISNYKVCALDYIGELQKQATNPRYHGLPLPEGTISRALGKRLAPGKVLLLAGHSNHGKSIFTQQLCMHVARQLRERNQSFIDPETGEIGRQQAVVYFTVEMGWTELISRAVMQTASVDGDRLANPDLLEPGDWEAIEWALKDIQDLPIYIVDQPSLSVQMIEKYLQALRREADIRLVVVDYLQILDSSGGTETEALRLKQVSMRLKHLARLLDSAFVVISSLNASGDSFLPTLSNIRNSGDIAYAVDLVAFLHQPFLADRRVGETWKDIAVFTVGKNRGGKVGQYNLRWNPAQLSFSDLDEFDESALSALPTSRYGNRG